MNLRLWLLCVSLVGAACANGAEPASTGATPPTAASVPTADPAEPPKFVFPQRREVEGYSLILHAPQIRSWENFESFAADIAIELTPPDGSGTRYGTATITGAADVDLDNRLVTVRNPKVSDVQFSGERRPQDIETVKHAVVRKEIAVPLDLFLTQLADDVLSDPPPPGFKTDPPIIVVASKPTILLFVNGAPLLAEVPGTTLKVVANANWPTFQDVAGKGAYYLLDDDLWLTAKKLDGGWSKAKSLPNAFTSIPPTGEHAAVRAAVPMKASNTPVPKVVYTDEPTELIVTEGKPKLAAIPGATPLQWVSNTESPLFKLDKTWYFLVAGRWFTTTSLNKGPWTYQPQLPPQFAQIPADHEVGDVLASVPGTVESKTAALEALLPTQTTAKVGAAPPVEVTYAGEPKFEPVQGTQLTRAVNTGYDIIEYQGQYYLCYSGIWYVAKSPVGPWSAANSVPDAIYTIPPSSPSYPVTQVQVVESTPSTIVYSYPPAYTSSVYVVYGVPYYGTGWYYPPYIWGPYYYPYWGSYGHGSWYNPVTGGYGSRSVWYGPYGGYSYTEGYNPRTGRYGYVETAWDGDDWKSFSEKYNPRTGTYTRTERHYDEDSEQFQTKRTIERGDRSMTTERTVDYDGNVSRVDRETASGASSSVERNLNDGTVTSKGRIETADGRTFTTEGTQTRTGGTSTITGDDGRTATATTKRDGGRSVTSIEGSGGGKGVSVSGEGPGRTTIGQSGSGDLYAGHNGNVYKKTDGGWQHYENGGWKPAEAPQRPDGGQRPEVSDYSKQLETARAQGGFQRPDSGASAADRDFSRLNRDYSARQRGSQSFQRRGSYQRGGFSGGGFRGGGFRGGGRRR